MKWGRLAADFYTDDKLEQLRHSEAYLFLKLVAWSVGHETGGRIPPSTLSIVGRGHRNVPRTIQRMCEVGLLTVDPTCVADVSPMLQRYNIHAFKKWQQVQPARSPKPAGQSPSSDSPSHVRPPARTENRGEIYESLSEDTLPPACEVKDPRLLAVMSRIGKKIEDTNGAAH